MTPAIPESLNQPTIQAPVGHQLGPLSYHFREQRIGALLNVGHIVEVTNKLPTGGLRATSLPNSPQLLNTRTHELPAKGDALFRGCVCDRHFEHTRSVNVDGNYWPKLVGW